MAHDTPANFNIIPDVARRVKPITLSGTGVTAIKSRHGFSFLGSCHRGGRLPVTGSAVFRIGERRRKRRHAAGSRLPE
jgi:hypothetical protein